MKATVYRATLDAQTEYGHNHEMFGCATVIPDTDESFLEFSRKLYWKMRAIVARHITDFTVNITVDMYDENGLNTSIKLVSHEAVFDDKEFYFKTASDTNKLTLSFYYIPVDMSGIKRWLGTGITCLIGGADSE